MTKTTISATACVTVIALTGIAAAQQLMPGINLNADRPPLSKEEQEKQKAVDDAYKSAIKKVPDKKEVVDPWGNMRSSTATSPKQR